MIKFSILITTKNRREELRITLDSLSSLILRNDVECLVYDDGSADGTSEMIRSAYPDVVFLINKTSKGYLFNRNKLLNLVSGKYAISLDDDANFLTGFPLGIIETYFEQNPNCGVIAARIFWGKQKPTPIKTSETPVRVQGFVGCGHVWNMKAWKDIPDYPEWFVFYGEEEFAAYQLFKKDWEVHYVPQLFVQHRVEVKNRKNQKDYRLRLRRSLRSGWYNYMLFLPWSKIPRLFLYTLFIQIKLKVVKGDIRATIAIFQALLDLMVHFPKLVSERNSLSSKEYSEYKKLPETKIYWKP